MHIQQQDATLDTPETDTVLAANPPVSARETWQGFHWSFFIQVQALIIALKRFQQALEQQDYSAASLELDSAATLLSASGGAMQLAGSFSAKQYDDSIRPSMMPPSVASENFSGLMCWEHASLMVIWRQMRSVFNNIPDVLNPAHERFVRAYYDMALGHTQVCEKFGGSDDGSLRFGERSGVESLKRFARNRSALIDPKQQVKGCPFAR